ncbi:hypothetical protein QG033_10720, partial [Kingella kingae]|nr:hypothetical protein [Kingella kingae]
EQSAQAYRLQQESTAIAQRAAQATARRHRAGLDNGLNQLATQDEVLVAQSQQLDAQAQQNAAWINANVALGGGWLP